MEQAQEGIALAQAQSDQYWVAACTTHLAYIYTIRGGWQQVLDVAEEAIAICQTYGIVQARTLNEMNQGLALAMLGQVEAGERLTRQAIAEREAINSPAGNQSTLARLAEACGRAGRVAEGLALMDEVWAKLATTIDREWEARYYLIQGDLLLRQALAGGQLAGAQQEAEAYFRQGVELAQRNQARLWEARTLASLCRLRHSQGRDEDCHQQLADLYAWFTEGFETEDLREVQSVLQEIGQGI